MAGLFGRMRPNAAGRQARRRGEHRRREKTFLTLDFELDTYSIFLEILLGYGHTPKKNCNELVVNVVP